MGASVTRVVELDIESAIAPQLFARLRDRIIRAELRPGEIISETEIARAYDVSRQPVREAFIKLSEAELVRIRPQRGTMIAPISIASVMAARFIREALEADVARTAAEKADGTAVRELNAQIEAQRRLDGADMTSFLKLDDLFHRTLAEIAGVPFAWRVVEGVKAQMDRVRYLSFEAFHARRLIRQHDVVAKAVAAADPNAAEAGMRQHLREILKSLPGIAEAHPDLFEKRG